MRHLAPDAGAQGKGHHSREGGLKSILSKYLGGLTAKKKPRLARASSMAKGDRSTRGGDRSTRGPRAIPPQVNSQLGSGDRKHSGGLEMSVPPFMLGSLADWDPSGGVTNGTGADGNVRSSLSDWHPQSASVQPPPVPPPSPPNPPAPAPLPPPLYNPEKASWSPSTPSTSNAGIGSLTGLQVAGGSSDRGSPSGSASSTRDNYLRRHRKDKKYLGGDEAIFAALEAMVREMVVFVAQCYILVMIMMACDADLVELLDT